MNDFNFSEVNGGTWTRLAILIAALINQVLVSKGIVNFPFTEQELAEGLSFVFTAIASLVCYWKNNSFTEKAQKADKELKEMKK